jgi:hypothetical protein
MARLQGRRSPCRLTVAASETEPVVLVRMCRGWWESPGFSAASVFSARSISRPQCRRSSSKGRNQDL